MGFSTISRTCTPRMVCEMLDELYLRFDAVMELPEFQPCYKASAQTCHNPLYCFHLRLGRRRVLC